MLGEVCGRDGAEAMTDEERHVLRVILEHLDGREWDFSDNPSDHSVCVCCGANSRTMGGLKHVDGCELEAALVKARAIVEQNENAPEPNPVKG